MLRDLAKACDMLLGLPKSLLFNVRYFGVGGLRLPVLLSWRVNLERLHGSVELTRRRFGTVRLGLQTTGTFPAAGTRSVWQVTGKVRFGDNVRIGPGFRIACEGDLVLGNGVDMNAGAHLFCAHRVEVGDGGLWAWNVVLTDHDFHHIEDETGKVINPPKAVILRDRLWIGANSHVLKGTSIGSDSVIGAASVVSGAHDEANCVLAGNPAKVVKRGIRWAR